MVPSRSGLRKGTENNYRLDREEEERGSKSKDTVSREQRAEVQAVVGFFWLRLPKVKHLCTQNCV
jgi:hypothetical protein